MPKHSHHHTQSAQSVMSIETSLSIIFLAVVLCLQVGLSQETNQTVITQDADSTQFTPSNVSEESEPIPLYIGTLQPTSVHWWATYGRYFVEFLQWVFDDVNARTDILPGYVLRLVWRDTQGKDGLAARQMFEMLTEGPPKLALCGAGLSDELFMAGSVAPFYNLPLLSFSAKTSNKFSSVFITNYQGEATNKPFLAILDYFGWSRVATIIYKDIMFETQMEDLHSLLKSRNVTLVTSAVVADTTRAGESLKRLKQFGARIIIGAFRASHAPHIFCQAYKQGLYGPSYVWLLTGAGMYDGWLDRHYSKDQRLWAPCSQHQVALASRGYLAVDDVYLRPDQDVVTVAGITASQYNKRVANFTARSDNKMSRSTPYAFDAAWALVLSLNKTINKLSEGALNGTRLEDFDYSRKDIFDLNLESLREISFEGVSGLVSFSSDGRRQGPHQITRHEDGGMKSVVGILHFNNSLSWYLSDQDLFYGYSPPRDRVVYETRLLPPSKAAVAVVLVINSLGIAADLGFLTFNIAYRKNSHIKMSSPVINNVILLGGLLMYIFVFVLCADYAHWSGVYNGAVCSVRVCLACLGFTVAFGALFSKTWRVHALFTHSEIKRKVIRDSRLLSIVLVIVMVDLVILVPWTVVNPLTKAEFEEEALAESTPDKIVTYKYTTCSHPNEIYWFMAEYIFKGLLLVFGAFLAWETRKVTIPAVNDSKLIGFCIYNIGVVCALAVPVVHVVGQDRPTMTFLLIGLFVSLCTTLVLCILFLPKVRLRNQVAERRFVSSLNQTSHANPAHSGTNMTLTLEPRDQSSGREMTANQGHRAVRSDQVVAQPHNMLLAVPVGSVSSKQLSTSTSSLAAETHDSKGMYAKNVNPQGHEQTKEDLDFLEAEVARLSAILTEELKAVAALKSALLTESHGQLQFHKVGKGYVIFNKGNASSEQEKRKEPKTFQTGETTGLKKEGDLYTTTTESST